MLMRTLPASHFHPLTIHPPHRTYPSNIQSTRPTHSTSNSIQLKVVSMRSGKNICASPRLSHVSLTPTQLSVQRSPSCLSNVHPVLSVQRPPACLSTKPFCPTSTGLSVTQLVCPTFTQPVCPTSSQPVCPRTMSPSWARRTHHLVVVSGGDAEDAGADDSIEVDNSGVGRGEEARREGVTDDGHVHCSRVRALRVRLVTH